MSQLAAFLKRPAWLLSSLGPWLRYLYLIRIQILVMLALVLMPVLARFTGARTLLLGAYDLANWKAAVAVGFCLVMLVRGVEAQKRLVDVHGLRRFGGPVLSRRGGFDQTWRYVGYVALLFNLLVIFAASEPVWHVLLQLLLGLPVGVGLGYLPVQKLGDWVHERFSLHRHLGKWLFSIFEGPVPGFIESERDDAAFGADNVILSQGHGMALGFGGLLLGVFFFIRESFVHPLVAVFLLMTVLSHVLGFAAFIVDRYRVPVIVYVIAFCGLMTLYSESDHFYPIMPLPAEKAASVPTPAEVLGKAAKDKSGIIIVTAAGGGIQSAAWVTEVLWQLGQRTTNPESFHDNVRLISGVSGGSVGALHYAHAFDSTSSQRFENAARAASKSSLSAATLGLVREDLIRTLAPWYYAMSNDILTDRCSLLQKAWEKNADESRYKMRKSLHCATLQKWGQEAAALKRPALIFNATITETGERMALSTVPRETRSLVLKEVADSYSGRGDFEFQDRYKADIQMTTAARLSATFPLVSAGARPAVVTDWAGKARVMPGPAHWDVFPKGGNMLHAVDGGYFENSGMVGALEWLENGLSELSKYQENGTMKREWQMPREILILELGAFAADKTRQEHVDKEVPPGGLLSDLISPLVTLANVRTSGQLAFSSIALKQFQQSWKARNVRVNHLRIEPDLSLAEEDDSSPREKKPPFFHIKADWRYAPLSWHLRETEKQVIREMATKVINKIIAEKAALPPEEAKLSPTALMQTQINRDAVLLIDQIHTMTAEVLAPEKADKKAVPLVLKTTADDPFSNQALLNRFVTPKP